MYMYNGVIKVENIKISYILELNVNWDLYSINGVC